MNILTNTRACVVLLIIMTALACLCISQTARAQDKQSTHQSQQQKKCKDKFWSCSQNYGW